MGYEKDVAAIVKAIEDHKKAATYDPMAMIKQNVIKKIPDEKEASLNETNESNEAQVKEIKHHLTDVFLSKEKQTILLSATLTKVMYHIFFSGICNVYRKNYSLFFFRLSKIWQVLL